MKGKHFNPSFLPVGPFYLITRSHTSLGQSTVFIQVWKENIQSLFLTCWPILPDNKKPHFCQSGNWFHIGMKGKYSNPSSLPASPFYLRISHTSLGQSTVFIQVWRNIPIPLPHLLAHFTWEQEATLLSVSQLISHRYERKALKSLPSTCYPVLPDNMKPYFCGSVNWLHTGMKRQCLNPPSLPERSVLATLISWKRESLSTLSPNTSSRRSASSRSFGVVFPAAGEKFTVSVTMVPVKMLTLNYTQLVLLPRHWDRRGQHLPAGQSSSSHKL